MLSAMSSALAHAAATAGSRPSLLRRLREALARRRAAHSQAGGRIAGRGGADGCPVACLGDAPFGYVNVFTTHMNVGFFQGASLPDPARLLQGSGKFMRHVKLKPGSAADAAALTTLIELAYAHTKARVEHG